MQEPWTRQIETYNLAGGPPRDAVGTISGHPASNNSSNDFDAVIEAAAVELPGAFARLAPVLDHYGYLAVFGFVFLEDFGIPVPGETVLIAAAIYAGAGRLNPIAIGLLAVLAATLGDNVGFAIGRLAGRAVILRYGRYVLLTEERLEKAEKFFERHGGKIIVIARFIEGLRQANGIVAGVSEMRWRRFLPANLLGAVLWVGVWLTVGDLAGTHINTIYDQITRYSAIALGLLAIVVVGLIARAVIRRRRSHHGPVVGPRGDQSAGNSTPPESRPVGSTFEEPPAMLGNDHKIISGDTLNEETHMALQLGDTAPDFTVDSTEGKINLHEYIGDGWGILFSHPKDFTPVCTTELGEVARLKPEFDKRNTKVLGVSVDTLESHKGWTSDIKDVSGHALNYPLLADPDRTVSDLYGMIHPNANDTLTVRSVFIIGPDKKIKLIITYPASTGRNFAEILRVLDSLQLSAQYTVATPVNWKEGEDVIIAPAVSDEDAKTKFPKGFKAVKPYLRYTPQPNR